MTLQSIRYKDGKLEILDQLLLPSITKYVNVRGVEDGWKVINKMQVSFFKCKQSSVPVVRNVNYFLD